MIERDPTALNYIIDQNNDRDEPIEIYEYKIKDNKKLNGRFFSAKFSFSGCLLALFVNIIALFVFSALLFAVYLIVVNASLRTYGEFCNKDSDCDTSFQLRCQFGICNCTSDYFHKSITSGCVRKLNNLGSCQLDEQCYGGQYCFNNVCDCSNDRFWNSSTLYCQKKSGYGGFCLNDVNCGNGTNMNCVSSKCGCSDPNVSYWNGTYCAPVQSFMGDCKTNSTCKPSSFLLCNTTELYPNKCACLPYHFWNSASEMCQSMKTVNETCDSSEECLSHTKLFCGLLEGVVYMSVKRCTCQSDHYWSPTSNSCEKKASYGEVCTVCDNTLLLSCNVANYCACDPTHFWNGTFCVLDISNGLNCDNNFDCDSALGLSCDATYRKCVCASTHYWKDSTCTLKQINGSYCRNTIECQSQNLLRCISNRCSCEATYFWNINICNVKYDANTYCTETYQCKDYSGLTCINGAGISSKSCQCGTNFYWEQSTQTCNSKKSHGLTCAQDYECRDSLGLICASTCLCPYTHYWDSGTCNEKKTYDDSCANTYQCKDYLALQCIGGKCQCNKMMYWDDRYGEGCLFKKTNNTACNGTNPHCQDYAGLSCIGYICQCTYPDYWVINPISFQMDKCQKPAGINQYCDGTTYKCEDGLVCEMDFNGLQICSCPKTQHYDGVSGKCVDFRTYGETCSFWENPCDDTLGLYCRTSGVSCSCPDNLATYRCDCRNTHYWDGSKCEPRVSHNQPCSHTYQCVLNKGLGCNVNLNLCMCEDFFFYRWFGNTCTICPNGQRAVHTSPYNTCVVY